MIKTFEQYKTFLQSQNIPGEVIESCRAFVEQKMERYTPLFDNDNELQDFGKFEYSEVQSQKQVVDDLKAGIISACIDFDNNGKDITLRNYDKILKSPFNLLLYTITKGYYLFYFDIEINIPKIRRSWMDKNIRMDWVKQYDKLFLGENGYLAKREKNKRKLMMKKLGA